jgi:hypothetical protein
VPAGDLRGEDGETELVDETLEPPRTLRREPGLVSRRVEARRRVGDDESHVRSRRRSDGGRNAAHQHQRPRPDRRSCVRRSGGSRGFLLKRGVLTMIDAKPDAVFTRASDINNRGQIVGDYATKPPGRR